jgi:hypothetical protein
MINRTNIVLATAALFGALVVNAAAGQLILPSSTLSGTGSVPITFKLPLGLTGKGTLQVRWTDSLDRLVEDGTVPIELTDETEIRFSIDLSRAIAMKNDLHAHLSLDGADARGKAGHHEEDADASFVFRPANTGWKDYAIIMWQPYPEKLVPPLEKLGINGFEMIGCARGVPDSLILNNVRWYCENNATDFYSEYHRYRADRIQNWSFLQAKALYAKDPASKEAFKRSPSFWDPAWRKTVHDRLVSAVQNNEPYRPYFYCLADESGIADLGAAWDFDFSDQSLVPMRAWLKSQYSSLNELNREWGTRFTTWQSVIPQTTDEAMKSPDDNFASWGDFKTWMDISYADALKMGVDAVHEVDRDAYVEIGGAQKPGWGGYDYARLAFVLDAMEPYDIGANVALIHSLNPEMPLLSTSFASGPPEKQHVWHELLQGNRGLIIWDEKHEYVQADGQASARGKSAAAYYNELRDGEGALIINSRMLHDGIAIHYSQPSLRTQWMLERRPDGPAWATRDARYERSNNDFLRLRESWCKLIEDEGLEYNFASYLQLPEGKLFADGDRVLILPQSSSLSAAEATAIREFIAQGGVAIADGMPGAFDEHSRRLPASPLADLFGGDSSGKTPASIHAFGKGKAITLNVDIANYLQSRLVGKEAPVHDLIGEMLRSNGVHPEFTVDDAQGKPIVGVQSTTFANGGVRLIAIQSNPQLRVDELGPPDFRSNERFEKPVPVRIRLPQAMYLYDTRTRKALGKQQSLSLTLDPYDPTILAASVAALPELQVSMPEHLPRGTTLNIGMRATPNPADTVVFHVDVLDPQGNRSIHYSGNVIAQRGTGMKCVPFAVDDAQGKWTVVVHDLLSGQTVSRPVEVE